MKRIIEADETVFPYSEKGSTQLIRQPCKRGMKTKKWRCFKDGWGPVLTVRDEVILPSVTIVTLHQELTGKLEK